MKTLIFPGISNLSRIRNKWRLLSCIVVVAFVFKIIGSYLLFILRSTSNNHEPVQSASLEYHIPSQISSQTQIKENIVWNQDTRDNIITAAKLIHNANIHVRGFKTSVYLKDALNIMKVILKNMNVEERGLLERTSVQSKSVCPESFKGGEFGFPHYDKGYETDQCDYSVPISELVTVIQYVDINQDDEKSTMVNLDKFVDSIHRTYHDVNTLIAINSGTTLPGLKGKYTNINLLPSQYRNEGFALNILVQEVKTPYVLIARGVEFFTNDSRLDRLVRELESLNVVAVGGAFRYSNGHWYNGCYQSVYRNYVLKYISGYDESFHECLFCDYIQGPFLTTTKHLKSNVFSEFNENTGLFEDFFLRTFRKNEETVICPDSMFHVKSKNDVQSDHMTGFLQKWDLFEMVTTEGITINRNCKFQIQARKSLALSPCSLRANNEAVNGIMRACIDADITCELRDGTALGAIKFGGPLPWELDFDIRVSFDNCSKCSRLEHALINANMKFNYFATVCCANKNKFGNEMNSRVRIHGYNGDLVNDLIMPSDDLVKSGLEPTKVSYGGQWLNIARNPGLYMRNRYGKEIYRHAEHWYYTGFKETKEQKVNYTSGRFNNCTAPDAHNCLDSYNADGNLPFRYLLP